MYHRDYLKRQSVRFTSSTYNEAYKRCKNKLNKLIKMTKEETLKRNCPMQIIAKTVGRLLMNF